MSSFAQCKKVELHIHLEGAASPEFVRETCCSSGMEIQKSLIKVGTTNGRILINFLLHMK